MSDQPISDLRRRMLQDMAVRQFGEKTQHDYIRHVEAFAKFLGRSPETVTVDDLRRFQFQQVADGAQPPKMNTQASALRFFLSITLGAVIWPTSLPAPITPESCRAFSRLRMWRAFLKRRLARASSTRRR